jgi:hypothetical protein
MKAPSIKPLIFISVASLFLSAACGFSMARLTPHQFYDGEGNTLPYRAVDSLVRSQYVNISKPGADTVNKYFENPPIHLPNECGLIKPTDNLKGELRDGVFYIEFNNLSNR